MRHVSRMGVLLPALLLIAASGCATKGWVLEELSRQQAEMGNQQAEMGQRIDQVGSETQRVNKRVDSVEGRVSQAFQKAESTDVRVGALQSSVTSASEAARGARERADAAMTKAEGVDGGLTKLWSNQQQHQAQSAQHQDGGDRERAVRLRSIRSGRRRPDNLAGSGERSAGKPQSDRRARRATRT